MIQISLKGLAKFMTATPANQRKILRDYKYPKEEGQAMALYYKEARDLIYSWHKHGHSKQWLIDRANDVRALALATRGLSGKRLGHNARGVEEYAQHFAGRKFEMRPDIEVSMTVDGVKIKINPDLHVTESGTEKIVRLDFTKNEPDVQMVKIICQMMFEGAARNGHQFTPSCVLYLDVPRGREHRGARQGSRMKGEIEAACKNIVSMWPSI